MSLLKHSGCVFWWIKCGVSPSNYCLFNLSFTKNCSSTPSLSHWLEYVFLPHLLWTQLDFIELNIQSNLQFWSACFFLTHTQHPNGPLTFINCVMRMRCNLFECCFTSTSYTFPKQSKWKILPYKKLAKVTDNFDQSHCLGKRGFATEYYGKWLSYGHLYEQRKYKRRKLRYNYSLWLGSQIKFGVHLGNPHNENLH